MSENCDSKYCDFEYDGWRVRGGQAGDHTGGHG